MRARLVFGSVAGLAIAATWSWACIPHPESDFEDYQERIKSFSPPTVDSDSGPAVDSGPPPTEAVKGTYYAACLTELANGQVGKIFSFWVSTEFVPNADAQSGGKLDITLEALALVDKKAPPTVTRAGITGAPLPVITGNTNAAGSFTALLDPTLTASFAGAANPISGGDVVLSNAGLQGKFAEARFCARLNGNVVQPAAAARTLNPDKNFCIFVPIKDGDTTPSFMFGEYSVPQCPL